MREIRYGLQTPLFTQRDLSQFHNLATRKRTPLRVYNKGVGYTLTGLRDSLTVLTNTLRRPLLTTAFQIYLHTQIDTPPDLPKFVRIGVV